MTHILDTISNTSEATYLNDMYSETLKIAELEKNEVSKRQVVSTFSSRGSINAYVYDGSCGDHCRDCYLKRI